MGGDETIRNIRNLSTPERCVDIAFSDRYSFCVIETEAVLELDERELQLLAEHFYNDTYLMDQNACSSPHLVVWLGKLGEGAKNVSGQRYIRWYEKNTVYHLSML